MDSRLPITEQILRRVVGALGYICSSTYESRMFSAAYTLAFYAFLKGELVLSEGNDVHSVLCINDIRMEDTQFTVVLKSSKTDQMGKGVTLLLRSRDSNICPVKFNGHFSSGKNINICPTLLSL